MAQAGRIGLVFATTDLDADAAVRTLKQDPAIEHVEKDGRIYGMSVSDDPFFTSGDMWNMYAPASTPANAYGTRAVEAWAAGHTGSQSVYVAILDGGIEITHPDLSANIWTNPFDSINGSDTDGNGYIDDLHGWDFFAEDNTVTDPLDGHGTSLAGVIGAKGGNALGVVGVNWNVTMIPARILDENGEGFTSDAVLAIDYCIDLKVRHGLKIVALNASWGSTTYSQLLHEAILRAAKAGILFVTASGNAEPGQTGTNNDTTPFWPANIDTTVGTVGETAATYNSVISVAAIDEHGILANFSNFGATKVHLGAPGSNVVSTYLLSPSGNYARTSGTSLAAPHVTGAAALYASTHPYATAQQIRSAILGAVAPTASLAGKTTTGGRLDLSTFVNPPAIVGRHIFYNNSSFDGDSGSSTNDDKAIAPDKVALLPGQTATFTNYTSYSRGINGIMVDISDLAAPSSISASDFTFKTGNNSTPAGWVAAPAPTSVTVRTIDSGHRITIIWANNAIQKRWLEVRVKANANTGLITEDAFYFGNSIGESGDSAANARVSSTDWINALNNVAASTTITNRFDFNRDKRVGSGDAIVVQNNISAAGIQLISPP